MDYKTKLDYIRRARVALRPLVWKTYEPCQSNVGHVFSSEKNKLFIFTLCI